MSSHRTYFQYLLINDHLWPYMTIHDHTWPYMTFHDYTWTIFDHICSYLTILDHTWPYMTNQDRTWPYMTTHDHTWPCMTINDHKWPYRMIQYRSTYKHRELDRAKCHSLSPCLCKIPVYRAAYAAKNDNKRGKFLFTFILYFPNISCTGLYITLQNHTGPNMTIHDHKRPYFTIHCIWQYMTMIIHNHMDHAWPYINKLEYTWPQKTIDGHT